MSMTRKDLERLQKEGKIRGWKENKKLCENFSQVAKFKKAKNKTKDWIGKNLWAWSVANSITLVTEHEFHPDRKWRFDWALPDLRVGIEYEGLMSEKSRHTTAKGYTGDAQKYNEAQRLGWRVFRYTAISYKDIIQELTKVIQ